MEKKDKFFYLFFISILAYEFINVPLLDLEARHLNGSIQYQVLFQLMFFMVILGLISGLELHKIAKRQCDDTLIYNHKKQRLKKKNV